MKRMSLAAMMVAMMVLGAACSRSAPKQSNSTAPVPAPAVTWTHTVDTWQPSSSPPPCPKTFPRSPTNIQAVTSILYPGQIRQKNYTAQGGFRFETAKSTSEPVVVPLDGQVVRGGRSLLHGQTQYTFDIMAPCGLMVRFGHLLTLTPKFQALANTLPAAVEGDSRLTLTPAVSVKAGEQVASAVGVSTGGLNVFFEFGAYNFNQKNVVSQTATYAANHDAELAQHAVCWLHLLPAADAARAQSLPAGDASSGKKSDYCSS